MFDHVRQVRHYDSVSWVSTNESSLIMEVANMRAFRRLFTYINGTNENPAFFIDVLVLLKSLFFNRDPQTLRTAQYLVAQ